MNKVILIGHITKDIDLRAVNNDTTVTQFTLAVQRDFTNEQGERQADFIQCVAWRKTADFLKKFAKKGSKLAVEGRIQTRTYESEGTTKYVTEVVVDRVELLDKKEDRHEDQFEEHKQLVTDDDMPF